MIWRYPDAGQAEPDTSKDRHPRIRDHYILSLISPLATENRQYQHAKTNTNDTTYYVYPVAIADRLQFVCRFSKVRPRLFRDIESSGLVPPVWRTWSAFRPGSADRHHEQM